MRPALAPPRRLAAAVLAGLAALATPGSARAAFVTAPLTPTGSTEKLASFSGTIGVDDAKSPTTATVRVELTNTSTNGGFITGFAFNLPVPLASATLTSTTLNKFKVVGGGMADTVGEYDDVAGQPFGFFDIGAALNGRFNGGDPAKGGFGVGTTATFTFTLTSSPGGFDLSTLTPQLLLSLASADHQGGGAQAFLVRFRGIPTGAGSDKVVIEPGPPPTDPPGVVPAPPALVLGLIGFGGLFLGRNFRRKTAAPATA